MSKKSKKESDRRPGLGLDAPPVTIRLPMAVYLAYEAMAQRQTRSRASCIRETVIQHAPVTEANDLPPSFVQDVRAAIKGETSQ